MAWRTTQEEVKNALGDNYDNVSNPSLVVFIDTASELVTEVVSCASNRGVTLRSALLVKIECWLAAHFYGHSDQFFQQKKTGDASATFQGQTGMNLESTQYGQTAITLDTSGCLAAISKGARGSVAWLGKNPSEQIPYKDRR
jgi:hypothetical protein